MAESAEDLGEGERILITPRDHWMVYNRLTLTACMGHIRATALAPASRKLIKRFSPRAYLQALDADLHLYLIYIYTIYTYIYVIVFAPSKRALL